MPEPLLEIRCPACQSILSSLKAVPAHTNACRQWQAVIGVPPKEFNFDRHFQRNLYSPELQEDVDFVSCKFCEQGQHFRSKRLKQHLEQVHQLTVEQYLAQFPGAQVNLKSTTERRKETTRELYGVDNVFQAETIKAKSKATCLEKYGTEHAMQSEEMRDRRDQTNLERHGVRNVFESQTFQGKAKETMVARYGVANAQQVPEIRARTEQTTLERHGSKSFLLSSSWIATLTETRREREEDRRSRLLQGPHEICPHCDEIFTKVTSRHKAICEGWPKMGVEPCLCGHVASSMTMMKRDHRPHCQVWRTRDADDVAQARRARTTVARYGVDHISKSPEVQAKTRATNRRRFGAASRFSREASTFGAIQESLRGRRFRFAKGDPNNPFSRPEVQAKVRETMLERYGVEHNSQSPMVQERMRQTSRERYGTDHPMQSPELQAKKSQTNLERYGHENAAASDEVKARIVRTNLERYGVKSTAAIPEFRRKQLETMEVNWGTHFFASDRGKQRVMEGMRRKYGVDYFAQVEGFWERQVQRFLEKFGVPHPLQLAEFLEKRRETCQRLYGVDSPLQSQEIMAKVVETCLERYGTKSHIESEHAKQIFLERYGVEVAIKAPQVREKSIRTCLAKVGKVFPDFGVPAVSEQDLLDRYGVAYPQKDREYMGFFLDQLGKQFASGPNKFEAKLLKLCWGKILYTGDRKFWRWLPRLGHHKNPDFIVPGPDPEHPRRDVTRVIECNGTFWHSERFTGLSNEDHERLLVEAYREVGIQCLVIWEHALASDPEAVRQRVTAFVESAPQVSREATCVSSLEVVLWD